MPLKAAYTSTAVHNDMQPMAEVKGLCALLEQESHLALLVLSPCLEVNAKTNVLTLSLTLSPPASSLCKETRQSHH